MDEARKLAAKHYAESVKLPYFVKSGSKLIYKDHFTPGLSIGVPWWASKAINEELRHIGLTLTCDVNRYWTFDLSVNMECAREVLAPLCAPNTRLVDQDILARQLRQSYMRSSLWGQGRQLDLLG